MSLFPHASLTHLLLETALIVVVADTLVAVAALAAAACLKRKPAAAHCVLAFALAWIFVVPLGAVARAVSGVSIVSLPGPAEVLVSVLEPPLPPPEAVGVEDTSNPTPTRESVKSLPRYVPSPNRPRLAPDAAPPVGASAASAVSPAGGPTLTDPYAPLLHGSRDAWPSRLGAGSVNTIGAAIAAAWLLGVLFLLTRIFRSYARMRAIRQTLTVLPEDSLGPVLDDVRRRLNLVRLPEIASSDRVWTPCVLGLFRPVIALPADALGSASPRELGDVLVHEGAHVMRHDCVMALFQKIVAALFWPHPLVHWLNRRLTSVREEVCDNYVLAGTDAVSYGETLLRFAHAVGRQRPVPAAVGMLHGTGSLEKRIAGLIDERRNRHTRAGNVLRALALVAFGSLFLLTCGGRGHSEEPGASKSEIGLQETKTSSIAQLPQPSPSPSTGAADHRGWMAIDRRGDKGRDRGSVRSRILAELKAKGSLSKAEIDSVQLVPGKPHTLRVSEAVRVKLGIRRDGVDQFAIAKRLARIPPLVLNGTTSLDPNRIVRLRPFPASSSGTTVVEIGKGAPPPHGWHGETGLEADREIRTGDRVHKGQLLVALYSVDVANTENDLVDALSQLKIDEQILKRQQAEAKDTVGSSIALLTTKRNLLADQNAANRAMRTLRGWGISEKEIQAVLADAEKTRAKDVQRVGTPGLEWGRIELRSPIDGVVLERNVALHEVIVDRDATPFQVGNLDRLLVLAQLPEKVRDALRALGPHPVWCVDFERGGSGGATHDFITEVGSFTNDIDAQVDPNLHSVLLHGDVDNKQGLLRGGQFVKVRIPLPIEGDVLEVPEDCIHQNSERDMVIFVQTDPAQDEFTAQRVNLAPIVSNNNDFLWSKPVASGDGTKAAETDPSRLPLKPVTPGTRLVQNGVYELWQILKEREKRDGEK